MGIFQRIKEAGAVQTQIRAQERYPFGVVENYVPLRNGEIALYRAIREAVPIIDAAIIKIIRLTSGFTISCGDERVSEQLNRFLRTINTGCGGRGIDTFINQYLDSMITCGRAVGEIVLSGRRDIAAVICGNDADIEIWEGESALDFKICTMKEGRIEPLPYQDLLLFTAFNPDTDSPYGVSLLRSMPFLTGILLKIYNSLGLNWDRAGNVRFAVVYKPQGDVLDKAYAKERSEQIAREWSNAMQSGKNGNVRDFVAVGDVDIRVIGADNQILDSEIPVKQILEQLVSKTGIPPFMLGLSWSSTERMSSQQADIMTSEITAIRRSLTTVVERICDMWMRIHGVTCDYEVVWDEINLQDSVEEARASLYLTQAERMRSEILNEGEKNIGN